MESKNEELKDKPLEKQKGNNDNQHNFTIEVCVRCGCIDVQSQLLEIPVGIKGVVSASIWGARCKRCGEAYMEADDVEAIRNFKKILIDLYLDDK